MEKLDLSTYAKEIKSNYDAVVSGDKTYAIYTTLKDSSLKPTALGNGDIQDFVSEFEEGSVQFGILRVNPFGSDVQKLVLLGWCPDSAPIKSKVSYATNFSNVGKILHYHVDITARDSDDLDIDDIMKTVSNASGARYSIQSLTPSSSSSVSVSGSKFKPTPKPASPAPEFEKPKPSPIVNKPKPSLLPKKVTDTTDGWGDEEEIKERDFSKEPLQTLPSAYKPTKVDINALRSGKPQEEKEPKQDFKPEPKVATVSINPSGGLTSLPKPKPSQSVLSRYNQQDVVKPEFGSKAPVFDSNPSRDSSKLVGGLSRNFGAEGGKTPAQIWAEKKGQYKDVGHDEKPVNAEINGYDHDAEEAAVNNVKSKFEQIQLKAAKEQEDKKFNSKSNIVSSFPPAETKESNSFPLPVTKSVTSSFPPPPKRDVLGKFNEKEPESQENDNDWGDEDEEGQEQGQEQEQELKEELKPVELPSRPIPSEPEAEPKSTTTTTNSSNNAVAEYDYEKDEANEIGFVEGEIITNIEFVDEDWWQGTNSKGETGLFPSSYVTLKVESKAPEPINPVASTVSPVAPSLPSRDTAPVEVNKSTGPSAVAEFDYDASEDNELTFKEGDIITDIDKVDEDWWLGSCNGERKLFPSNYVTLN